MNLLTNIKDARDKFQLMLLIML